MHRGKILFRYCRKKGMQVFCISLMTLFFANLSVVPCTGAPPAGPPPMVDVALITEKVVNPPMEYVGRIEAIQSVDIQARVQGYLEKVEFKEGSRVKAGDLLYVIEQAPYGAKVNADKAKVAEAKAALSKARQYRKRLAAVSMGGVSETDLETARAEEQGAQSKVEEALANLEVSRLNLNYTTIEAPISGRIGISNITKGNLVGPDSGKLARIVQMNPIRVVYSVSESDRLNVLLDIKSKGLSFEDAKKDMVPRIRLPNAGLYEQSGRIEFADNEVDKATGTVAVYAVFDNPDEILVPGQYVRVLLSLANPRKMPVVPQSAVLEDREGQYVFIVDADKRVQRRNILTGVAMGTEWVVKSGLMPGESVVVSGVQKVRSGITVNPRPAAKNPVKQ